MRFGTIQKKNFGTKTGAYSVVTERENFDSQITLTDYEAEMVVSHFGRANIHIGNVKSNKALSAKQFLLFPDKRIISLNLVFPKAGKTELRLYISSRAGYMPKSGDIWFMFVKDGFIWIGAMPEPVWRFGSSVLKIDETDELYQNSVNDTDKVRILKLKERDIFARDRNVAVKRMNLADFKCEVDPAHRLFVSRFSHKPYLEAHHLVPIGLQGEFKRSLDTIHNVFCLCPFCHRAVHHSEVKQARNILETLATKRPVLDAFSLTVPDLLNLYAVEAIV